MYIVKRKGGRLFKGARIRGARFVYSNKKTIDSERLKTRKPKLLAKEKELGLVVPAKYTATTNDVKFAEVLVQKLEEKKNIDNEINES